MNVQEYISSGIVESYVLGLASDEDRREFEQRCVQYPEVLAARTAFELALEKQAMENAITPPPFLKDKIFDEVAATGKIVSMQSAAVKKLNPVAGRWWKYAAAACLILLTGSIYLNISLSGKNKKLQNNYDTALAELGDVKKDIEILQQNPNVKMATMKGLQVSPQSYATIYWDTASNDVYLLANNLPVPPTDKQYQLWALLDGQPVDLGMIDYDLKQKKLLFRMKNARAAQAFAITLEKRGSNLKAPEGDMYVMGGL